MNFFSDLSTRSTKIFILFAVSMALSACGVESVDKRGEVPSVRKPTASDGQKTGNKNQPSNGTEENSKNKAPDQTTPAPDHPTAAYALWTICTGWPYEGGQGLLEIYKNIDDHKDRVVLIRTDEDNGAKIDDHMGILTSYGVVSEKGEEDLIIERKAAKKLPGIRIDLKYGTNLKATYTEFQNNGSGSAQIYCSTLFELTL